jgi:XTP/dITP diphosphohydrolase
MIDISSLDPASTVVVATGNAHKVVEIEAILGKAMPGKRFVALGELGSWPDAVEDAPDFEGNALIKARAALDATGLALAVADDSGLVVDALDGEPGVLSARWAGEHGNDDANNDKLERLMADVPEGQRGAHFHSTVALVRREPVACPAPYDPATAGHSFDACELVFIGNGDCPGHIGYERVGTHGFGYDPLFLPDDTPGRTMAELELEEKNQISHRFRALTALAAQLA